MTNKELKKLTRTELLELLLAQTHRADGLEKEVETLKEQLSKRDIAIRNSGSIAEAALKLNGVFEAAQAAADQYFINVKQPGVVYERKSTGYQNYSHNFTADIGQYPYNRVPQRMTRNNSIPYQSVPRYGAERMMVYNIRIFEDECEE